MRAEPWLDETMDGINPRFHSGVTIAPQLAASAMSPVVVVFGRRQQRGSARSTDRRPKSAKARSRGRLGRGDAASYGIWLAGLIRSQATKFLYDRLVAWPQL